MRIVFGDGSYSRINEAHQQALSRGSRRRGRTDEMRARRAERELRMQEMENKRIEKIHKRMERIQNLTINPELCPVEKSSIREHRNNLLDMLADQIARVHEKRAEREAANAELEAREMQAQLEEHLREREEKAEEMAESQPDTPREPEEKARAAERNLLTHLTRADLNRQAIHGLAQVRGARSMEALQLRHAIDSPNSTAIAVTVTDESTYRVRTFRVPDGRSNPEDFRNSHLRALEQGIARLDEAIMARVVDMYRTSQQMGRELREAEEEQAPEQAEPVEQPEAAI